VTQTQDNEGNKPFVIDCYCQLFLFLEYIFPSKSTCIYKRSFATRNLKYSLNYQRYRAFISINFKVIFHNLVFCLS